MNKDYGLKELRFLVSHLEPDAISYDDLDRLLKEVRAIASRNIDPVFQTGNFRCWQEGPALKNFFRVEITILDPTHPFPSQEEIGEIMDHYGVRGEARYFIKYGINKIPATISLSVTSNGEENPILKPNSLTPKQARILDSKVEGWSYIDIAREEGCDVNEVVETLVAVSFKGNRYGFRQIWPEGMEMIFSEDEYAKVVRLPELQRGVRLDG